MTFRSYLILLVVAFFLLPSVLRTVSAFYWSAENATVHLSNCSTDCELKGTLRIAPWTGDYYITNETGRIYFSKDNFSSISYPAPTD